MLRRVNRPVLVLDQAGSAKGLGEVITHEQLDALAARLGDNARPRNPPPISANDRFFILSWKGSDIEWMLMEDEEARVEALAEEAEAEADTALR
jgi:hypothetical protein